MIKLYDYFRSTASYRVRIALHLKGIAYEAVEVHLVDAGGQQHSDGYVAINPQRRVPCLVDGDVVISQSLAIIDYLEDKYPEVSVYCSAVEVNARIRMIAQTIACDIHPLNNLSVLQYLKDTLECSDQQKLDWYHHWLALGFTAIEAWIDSKHDFCVGDCPSLADICLVPQVYNANRFDFDMAPYPNIRRVNQHCLAHKAFKQSAP